MRLIYILALTLLLPACVSTTARKDVPPAQHRQWAQELLSIHDKKGAIDELKMALSGNPNIEDALLYGDLLESQKEYKRARKAYKNAYKYPADDAQKLTLNYRLALLEAGDFDNFRITRKLIETLPPVDSRRFDLQSVLFFKQGDYKSALESSQRALARAQDNEEQGWAHFHMAQIYYELRIERDTFGSLFKAVNTARGHSLVARITEYWEDRRHVPFPED